MTNAQVTLIQIDNYGPWTVTPEPRREVDLQTLQSRLYADLSQLVGNREGYTFFTRFDNIVAVTNGMDEADHAMIQESVGNRYPVTVSFGVGVDPSPVAAISTATEHIQDAGSAQSADRTEILRGRTLDPDERTDEDVQIAHFDVNDATGKYTDRMNAFDSFVHIEQGYAELMQYFRRAHEGLSFFVGGDNVIAVSPDLGPAAYEDTIEHVEETASVELKVGVGQAATAQSAGMAAKHALEDCRENGDRVVFED